MSLQHSQPPEINMSTTQQSHESDAAERAHKRSVVVIGAGLSGLSCASDLQKHGKDHVDVVVLEARHRMGGRTWTVDLHDSEDIASEKERFKSRLDLGAAWIHGIDGNPLYTRFKDSLTLCDTRTGLICDPQTGKPLTKHISHTIWHRAAVTFEIVTNWVRANPQSPCSWSEVLEMILSDSTLHKQLLRDLDPKSEQTAIALLKEILSNYEGADPSEFAAIQEAATQQLQGREPIIKNGYRSIVQQLAQHVDVQLKQPVERIEHSAAGVTIVTRHGKIHADAVVCTIPLGVLKKHHASLFSPPLPANKQKAIEKMGVGLLDKIVLTWKHQWWTNEMDFATFLPRNRFLHDANGIFVLECLDMTPIVGSPCLVFIVAHKFASALESWTDVAIENMVVNLLASTFAVNVPKPSKCIMTRWNQDEFARGAYSYVPVGIRGVDEVYETIEHLAEPLLDENGVPRVYFAGEHCSKYWFSFTHGAYSSGADVAGAILKNVRGGVYKPSSVALRRKSSLCLCI